MTTPLDPMNFGITPSFILVYDSTPVDVWQTGNELAVLAGFTNASAVKAILLKQANCGLLDMNSDIYPIRYRRRREDELGPPQLEFLQKMARARYAMPPRFIPPNDITVVRRRL